MSRFDTSQTDGAQRKTARYIEVFENQRLHRGKWSAKALLSSDPLPFGDRHGQSGGKAKFAPLPTGFAWADGWKEDEKGWVYGVTWSDCKSEAATLGTDRHRVRRRRFTRRLAPVADAPSTPTAGPLTHDASLSSSGSSPPELEVEMHGDTFFLVTSGNETVARLQEQAAGAFLRAHPSPRHTIQVTGLWARSPDGGLREALPLDPTSCLSGLLHKGAERRLRLWGRLRVSLSLLPGPIGLSLDPRIRDHPVVKQRFAPDGGGNVGGTATAAAASAAEFVASRIGWREPATTAVVAAPRRQRGEGLDAVRPGMTLIRLVTRPAGCGEAAATAAASELATLPPEKVCQLFREAAEFEKIIVLTDPAPGDASLDSAAIAAELARGRRTPPYTVTVVVAAARGLRRADVFSSDPYVCLRLAGTVVRTRVIDDTRSPTWEETFTFTLLSRSCNLVAQIWNCDSFSSDDPLGEVTVPLGDSDRFVVNAASATAGAGGAAAAGAAGAGRGRGSGGGGARQEHDEWWNIKGGSGQLRLRIRIDQNIRLHVLPKVHRVAAMVLQRTMRNYAARRAESKLLPSPWPPRALLSVSGKAGNFPEVAPKMASVVALILAAQRERSPRDVAAARPPITLEDVFRPESESAAVAAAAAMAARRDEAPEQLCAVTLGFLGGAAKTGPFSGSGAAGGGVAAMAVAVALANADTLAHDVRVDLGNKRVAEHATEEGLMEDSTVMRFDAEGEATLPLAPRRLALGAAAAAARAGVVRAAALGPQVGELLSGRVAPVLAPPPSLDGNDCPHPEKHTVASSAEVEADGADVLMNEASITLRYADGSAFRVVPGDEHSYWRFVAVIAFAALHPASSRGSQSGGNEALMQEAELEGDVSFSGEAAAVSRVAPGAPRHFGRVLCSLEKGGTKLHWSGGPHTPGMSLDLAVAAVLELSHDYRPSGRHMFAMTVIGGDFAVREELGGGGARSDAHSARRGARGGLLSGRKGLKPYCRVTVGGVERMTLAVGGARPFWNCRFNWSLGECDLEREGVRLRAFSRRFPLADSRLGEVFVPFKSLTVGQEYVESVQLEAGRRKLRMLLKSAHGLPIADATGASDPYCVLVPLRRDGSKVDDERMVSVKRSKTVNPVWDQTFEFEDDDLQGIEVTVFDHDFASSDDVLGRFFCPVADFGAADCPAEISFPVKEVSGMDIRKMSHYGGTARLTEFGTVNVVLSVIAEKSSRRSGGDNDGGGMIKVRCGLEAADAYSAAWPALLLEHPRGASMELPELADRRVEPFHVAVGFGHLVLRPNIRRRHRGAVEVDIDVAAAFCRLEGGEGGEGGGSSSGGSIRGNVGSGGMMWMEVYEYQRKHPVLGWGNKWRHLSRTDPARFADATGLQALPVKLLDDVQPLAGWHWASPAWECIGDWYQGRGSFSALAQSFGQGKGSATTGNSSVRRRLWRRALQLPAVVPSGCPGRGGACGGASLPAALKPFCLITAHNADLEPGAVVLEVYENQRHQPHAGWGSSLVDHLLARDPPPFSNRAGDARLDTLQDVALDAMEGFALVRGPAGEAWRQEAWRYADEFVKFPADGATGGPPQLPPRQPTGVRRRRWVCLLQPTAAADFLDEALFARKSPRRSHRSSTGSVMTASGLATPVGGAGTDAELRLALGGVRQVCALSCNTLLVSWEPPDDGGPPGRRLLPTAVTLVVGPCDAGELGSLLLERINVLGLRASLSHMLQNSQQLSVAMTAAAAHLPAGRAEAAKAATAAVDPGELEGLVFEAAAVLRALQAGITAYGAAYNAVATRHLRLLAAVASGGGAAAQTAYDLYRKVLWCRLVRLHAYLRELICSFPSGGVKRVAAADDEGGWAAVMDGIRADIHLERFRHRAAEEGNGSVGSGGDGGSGGGSDNGGGPDGGGSGGCGHEGYPNPKRKCSGVAVESVAVVRALAARLDTVVTECLLSAHTLPEKEVREALAVFVMQHFIHAIDEVGKHLAHRHALARLDDGDLLELLDLLLNGSDIVGSTAGGALDVLGWAVRPPPLLSDAVSVPALLASYAAKVEDRLNAVFDNIVANSTLHLDRPRVEAAQSGGQIFGYGSGGSFGSGGGGRSDGGGPDRGDRRQRVSLSSCWGVDGGGDSSAASQEPRYVEILKLLETGGQMPLSPITTDAVGFLEKYVGLVAGKFCHAPALHALVLRAGANALSGLCHELDAWACRVCEPGPAWLPDSEKMIFLAAIANDAWLFVTGTVPALEEAYPEGADAGAADAFDVIGEMWLELGHACMRRAARLLLLSGGVAAGIMAAAAQQSSGQLMPALTSTRRDEEETAFDARRACRGIRRAAQKACPLFEPYFRGKLLALLCDHVVVRLVETLLPRAAEGRVLVVSEQQELRDSRDAIEGTFASCDEESGAESSLWRSNLAFLDEVLALLTTPPAEMLRTYRAMLSNHPDCQRSLSHALEAALRLRVDTASISKEVRELAGTANGEGADASPGSDADRDGSAEPFQRLFGSPVEGFTALLSVRTVAMEEGGRKTAVRGGEWGLSLFATGGSGAAATEGKDGSGLSAERIRSGADDVRLTVGVIEAENLPNPAFFGKIDSYCVLILELRSGTMERRTEVEENTLDPKWREMLVFHVPSVTEAQLTVAVVADRGLLDDAEVGHVEVPLSGFDTSGDSCDAAAAALEPPSPRLSGAETEEAAGGYESGRHGGLWYDLVGGGRLLLKISVERLSEEFMV